MREIRNKIDEQKKRRAIRHCRSSWDARRLRTGYPEPGDLLPLFFSLPPPHGLVVRGRAYRSSGFHPQAAWPGRKVRQYERCESGRVADQPFALHAEALDRRGRDNATGLANSSRSVHPDHRTPEPLLRRRPPRNFRSNSPRRAWSRLESRPFPCTARSQYRSNAKPRKRRCFFGLAH